VDLASNFRRVGARPHFQICAATLLFYGILLTILFEHIPTQKTFFMLKPEPSSIGGLYVCAGWLGILKIDKNSCDWCFISIWRILELCLGGKAPGTGLIERNAVSLHEKVNAWNIEQNFELFLYVVLNFKIIAKIKRIELINCIIISKFMHTL